MRKNVRYDYHISGDRVDPHITSKASQHYWFFFPTYKVISEVIAKVIFFVISNVIFFTFEIIHVHTAKMECCDMPLWLFAYYCLNGGAVQFEGCLPLLHVGNLISNAYYLFLHLSLQLHPHSHLQIFTSTVALHFYSGSPLLQWLCISIHWLQCS